MSALIIYDSLYGNTEKISQVVAASIRQHEEAQLIKVGDVRLEMLTGIRLLVVGSPTQQFRPTPAMRELIARIPKNSLKGLKVAAFDTRLTQLEIDKTPPLPFFVRLFGFAAERLAKLLKNKGGDLILPGEGFFVEGMKGPLKIGELERAEIWAGKLFA